MVFGDMGEFCLLQPRPGRMSLSRVWLRWDILACCPAGMVKRDGSSQGLPGIVLSGRGWAPADRSRREGVSFWRNCHATRFFSLRERLLEHAKWDAKSKNLLPRRRDQSVAVRQFPPHAVSALTSPLHVNVHSPTHAHNDDVPLRRSPHCFSPSF